MVKVYIILIQIKTLTENYDQILHKNTLIKIYDHMLDQSKVSKSICYIKVHLPSFCTKNFQRKNGLSALIEFLHQNFQLSISNKCIFSLISLLS